MSTETQDTTIRYEVREQSKFQATLPPEDRGLLIGTACTWPEAVALRDKAIAAGFPAYIASAEKGKWS